MAVRDYTTQLLSDYRDQVNHLLTQITKLREELIQQIESVRKTLDGCVRLLDVVTKNQERIEQVVERNAQRAEKELEHVWRGPQSLEARLTEFTHAVRELRAQADEERKEVQQIAEELQTAVAKATALATAARATVEEKAAAFNTATTVAAWDYKTKFMQSLIGLLSGIFGALGVWWLKG